MEAKDLPRHGLLGLEVEVVDADNASLVGIRGIVTGETKNMLAIRHCGKTRKIIKSQVKLKIMINGEDYYVDGRVLMGKPEDRLKKAWRAK